MNLLLIDQVNYYFEKGYLYSIISNITTYNKKLVENNNLNNEKVINIDVGVFLNKNISVFNLLSSFNLSKEDIEKIINEVGIDIKAKTFNLDSKIRSLLILNILFYNSEIIMFNTSGLSYETAKEIYQYLFDKIQHTQKIGLIFEKINKDNQYIEKINKDIIANYSSWIKRFYI